MKTSINDVAEKAGVSIATVSRAFSEKNYVKKETKEHILTIAKELGYTPKIYKKNVEKTVYRSTVGVILPDLNNNFYYEIIKGIESKLNEEDIDVMFCCTWNNPRREIMYIDLFNRIKPKGLVVVPCAEHIEENRRYLRELASQIDIVILDRELRGENLDGVFMNNFASAYQGTSLLINEGHKDIAFLCGSLDSTSSTERLSGYQKALLDHSLTYDAENVIYGDFDYQKAYEQTKKFLCEGKKVTAFFSSSSTMANGSMLAIAEKGISIPKDISFLTYGYSEWNDRNISYLCYPGQEMGEECAKILLKRMKEPRKNKKSPKKRSIFEVSIELLGSEKNTKNM